MRKLILSIVLIYISDCFAIAQEPKDVRIRSGEDPALGFSAYGFYRFPTFNKGFVFLKKGGTSAARLNYHILNDEIQFISANGDTLALADPLSISYITIDSSWFYYSNGYLEVIANHASLKLARKLRLNMRTEKIGGYGQPSPSGSIRTPNKIIRGSTGQDLNVNQDIIIHKEFNYYWLDQYNTVLKATKVNLLKLLDPDKKVTVEEYLKKNKVDFNNELDLQKLLNYSLKIP